MWKKNFFNKSVNLSTKFSKKSIFVEKGQKIPPDQQWVEVEKVVFWTIFSVLSVILYQKTVFFWGFCKCSKFSVPAAIGSLDFILSTKNVKILNMWCQKFMNFENISLNFFHVFRKKLKKKEFFWLRSHIEKVKKNKDFFTKIIKSLWDHI